MEWSDEGGCLTCGEVVAGGAGCGGATRLPSGERLAALAQRTGGPQSLPSAVGSLCERCVQLLQRLHRAEEKWLAARARFLLVLGREPPPHPSLAQGDDASPRPELPSPPHLGSSSDEDDEPLNKWKIALCDPDRISPDSFLLDANGESPDEPLIKCEPETIQSEYSCRECSMSFEDKSQAALHAFSIHRIDQLTDPGVIVNSNLANKKKKHSRKHKRKSQSDDDDDDDWNFTTKKIKPKRFSSDETNSFNSLSIKTASQLQKKLGSSNLTIKKVPYTNKSDSSFAASNSRKIDKLTVIGKADPSIVLSQLQTAGLEINSNLNIQKKKEKKQKKMLPCPECPSTFSSQARLDFHMVKHAGSKPPYICEICGASYKHKKACDIHVGMHKGISPWKCNECGKIFPSKGALSRHEAIHTGTPNYQCDLCGKSFIHTSSFKMHKLSHSGLKPHTCTKCGLSLMTRSHLKRHQRVHSGEKRHECESCGKKFSERYNLYAHQRGHYGTEFEGKSKSHDCSVCETSFTRRHLLDKHMEVVHHRVIDAPTKRPRNTMSKHLKQQINEPQVDIIEVKLSLSPTPQTQLKIEAPIAVPEEIIQRDVKPDIQTQELTECHENLEPPLEGQQPWDRIPSLANDYPLRMHGVDYAGYLNRQ